MKLTKHYLFDLDGTLIDSMPYWARAMTGILDSYGIKYGDDIIRIITPLGARGTALYFQTLGLQLTVDEFLDEIQKRLVGFYIDLIPAKEHVCECIKKMKEKGLHLHVLTASTHAALDPCLKRLGIFDMFDNVWSSDDFGIGKNNPQIYFDAAERMGTTVSDITFLDDNINADLAAKDAGVTVIGVYDPTSKDDEAKMREVLDGYIVDFSELEKMLDI